MGREQECLEITLANRTDRYEEFYGLATIIDNNCYFLIVDYYIAQNMHKVGNVDGILKYVRM